MAKTPKNMSFIERYSSVFKAGEFSKPIDDKGVEIAVILEKIKDGFWSEKVDIARKLRQESKEKYNEYRLVNVPQFTPCGVFNPTRSAKNLSISSGIIPLDFDNITEDTLKKIIQFAKKQEETFAIFKSLSGKGLAVFVCVPREAQKHKERYNALVKYYSDNGYYSDVSGSDVSRMRFVSFDPDTYINIYAKEYTKVFVPDLPSFKSLPKLISDKDDFLYCIDQIQNNAIDITGDYIQWLNVLFAIHSEFGAGGEDYAFVCSQNSPLFNETNFKRQWQYVCKHRGHGITISTFYYYCSKNGIKIVSDKNQEIATKISHAYKKKYTKEQIIKDTSEEYNKDTTELVEKAFKNPDLLKKVDDSGADEVINFINSHDIYRDEIIDTVIFEGQPIEDTDYNTIWIKGKQIFNKPPNRNDIFNIINSDFIETKNPIIEYINSNRDKYRVNHELVYELLACIPSDTGTKEDRFLFFSAWYMGIIASIYGEHNPLCFALIGNKMGTGKTEFFRRLLPNKLIGYFSEASIDVQPADLNMRMAQNLILFMDELNISTNYKQVKQMLSSVRLQYRPPYGRTVLNRHRLSSFCATSNEIDIISDPHGNRRIVPIHVNDYLDIERLNKIDREALFFHFVNMYKKGIHFLTREENNLLMELSQVNQEISEEQELILTKYEVTDNEIDLSAKYLSASEINSELFKYYNIRLSTRKISLIMNKLGFYKKKIKGTHKYLVKEI